MVLKYLVLYGRRVFGLNYIETIGNLGKSVLIKLLALVAAIVANRFLSNVKHFKHLIDVSFLWYVTLAFNYVQPLIQHHINDPSPPDQDF